MCQQVPAGLLFQCVWGVHGVLGWTLRLGVGCAHGYGVGTAPGSGAQCAAPGRRGSLLARRLWRAATLPPCDAADEPWAFDPWGAKPSSDSHPRLARPMQPRSESPADLAGRWNEMDQPLRCSQ
ncbi:hypothetical protein KIL84_008648 [Mauremys mutica]|uniref:Uncharacterized protein n=1 Tax=Mauremys mutica TaxID=74926 RepID=A0A9D4ASL7_9SAUR|nr:hypothetical protein KIL84_008648 [Mauremys mutica]